MRDWGDVCPCMARSATQAGKQTHVGVNHAQHPTNKLPHLRLARNLRPYPDPDALATGGKNPIYSTYPLVCHRTGECVPVIVKWRI